MKHFTTGAIAGASSLLIAVPLLAQFAGAASSSSTSASLDPLADLKASTAIPTQECVQAMADQEGAMLAQHDEASILAQIRAHREAMIEHQQALDAAADITDDAARKEAIQKAHEAMRTAMMAARPDDAAMTANTEAMQASMDAMREDCGDDFHFMMGGPGPGMMMGGKFMMKMHGPGGHGPGPGPRMDKLADLLGVTEEELKTALESGKTVQDIATEKGVELPEPKLEMRGDRDVFFFRGMGPMMSAPIGTSDPAMDVEVDVDTSTSSSVQ